MGAPPPPERILATKVGSELSPRSSPILWDGPALSLAIMRDA